jgi:hypothetical protein
VGDQIDPEKAGTFNVFRMFIDRLENPVKVGIEKFDFKGAIVITTKVDFVKDKRRHSPSWCPLSSQILRITRFLLVFDISIALSLLLM